MPDIQEMQYTTIQIYIRKCKRSALKAKHSVWLADKGKTQRPAAKVKSIHTS
jgi:hypothetical protein